MTKRAASRRQGKNDPANLAMRPQSEFFNQVRPFFPGLQEEDLMPHQIGIQARLAGHQDWVVEFSEGERRCLNILGIDSPGLTGSLAIARHVRALLAS